MKKGLTLVLSLVAMWSCKNDVEKDTTPAVVETEQTEMQNNLNK